MGSVEDRVLREQVFRERQEKVAHVEAMTKILAQVFNIDAPRVFGHIVRDYTREVFQESYDADLLRRKIEALRRAQERVRMKRREDLRMIGRLEKMGEYYDKVMGPVQFGKKPVETPRKPPNKTKPVK